MTVLLVFLLWLCRDSWHIQEGEIALFVPVLRQRDPLLYAYPAHPQWDGCQCGCGATDAPTRSTQQRQAVDASQARDSAGEGGVSKETVIRIARRTRPHEIIQSPTQQRRWARAHDQATPMVTISESGRILAHPRSAEVRWCDVCVHRAYAIS